MDHQSNMETKTDCDPSGNPTSTSTSASKKRPADDELSNEHIFDQSDDGVGRENKVLRPLLTAPTTSLTGFCRWLVPKTFP